MFNKITNKIISMRPKAAALYAAGYLVVLLQVFAPVTATAAGTATISFDPPEANISQGFTRTISVVINAATAKVTAAQACVQYDSTKLTLINTDYSGTPLGSTTPSDKSSDCAASEIQLSRYSLSSHPNGSFVLGRLTFKAVTASGEATLTVGSKSFIYDNSATSSAPASVLNQNGSDSSSVHLSAAGSGATYVNTAAISDTNRKSEPAQATSNDILTSSKTRTKPAGSYAAISTVNNHRVYILSGVLAIALVVAALLAKFVGIPGQEERRAEKRAAENDFEAHHPDGPKTDTHKTKAD